MKRLTCEMCESTDFLKQEGMFVCQNCGMKYSAEEAKSMMKEVPDGTSADNAKNSQMIENYLTLARNALEASNNKEAEEYSNKIIELDPKHVEAWLIKGEAAGWQSTVAAPRISEAVTAWENAIEYASKTEISTVRETVASKLINLSMAMIKLKCNNFATIPDSERANAIINELENAERNMEKFVFFKGVSFNKAPFNERVSQYLNEKIVAGYNTAKEDFGPEHINMSQYAFEKFIDACDSCLNLLYYAFEYSRDVSSKETICKNFIVIGETIRDSCSWEFDVDSYTYDHYVKDKSFTAEAKRIRTKAIDEWERKKDSLCKISEDELVSRLQNDRIAQEEKLAREKYWEEHIEEKEKLISEKTAISAQIERANKEKEELPIISEIKQKTAEIKDLESELSMLSIFKIKEKKELRDRINAKESEKNALKDKKAEKIKIIDRKISSLESNLEKINSELLANRGRISVDSKRFVFENPIEGDHFTITPNMVLEYFMKNASDTVVPSLFNWKRDMANNVFAKHLLSQGLLTDTWGETFTLHFKNPNLDEKKNKVGVPIQLAADTEDSPIKLFAFTTTCQTMEEALDYSREASYLIKALLTDENIDLDAIEEAICKLVTSKERSLYVIGPLRLECANWVIFQNSGTSKLSLSKQYILIRVNDDK